MEIEFVRSGMLQSVLAGVSHYAFDGNPVLAVEADALPDGVFIRPAVPRHGLIDEGDYGSFFVVASGKIAAPHQGLADRLEIVGIRDGGVDRGQRRAFRGWLAFDFEILAARTGDDTAGREGRIGNPAHRGAPADGAHLARNSLAKTTLRCVIHIPAEPCVDTPGEKVHGG